MQPNPFPPGADNDTAPRLLVDLNSLLNAALLGGKDKDAVVELVDGKPVAVNSALYGVEKFFARLAQLLNDYNAAPRNVIGVWDGKNAKAVRQAWLPGYKASTRATPVYEQLNLARAIVTKMLRDLGAHTVQCETCEADDTIAYLAQRLRTRPNIVVSGDGDLCVLVDDNTSVLKLDNSGRGLGDKLNENPFGPFPHKFITVYKALVGDASDKIPGAKGFGDSAFVKLVAAFGVNGLAEMQRLIETGRLRELAEDVAELPALQKIVDDANNVTVSWKCAKLKPERVNTMRHPLEWVAGFVRKWNELPEGERVEALKPYYATTTLVHAGNYDMAKAAVASLTHERVPFVALDIETSVPEESLSWRDQTRSRGAKGVAVDVLGSRLTGMSLTFGANAQNTIYVTTDHRETEKAKNVTSAQARQLVEAVPGNGHILVHNRAFELPVLRQEWGDAWAENGWHGFLPNALDTKIEASYVDENLSLKLKARAKAHFNYDQETYEQVTTLKGPVGTLPAGGERVKLVTQADGSEIEHRQYRMNELTAEHVFGYGCDDTRVTAALHTWFRIIMEIEGTWQTSLDVEQLPEYLTSLAFLQGIPIDLGKLAVMEAQDRAALMENQQILDQYLIEKGWEGTVLPQFDEVTPEAAKTAARIVLGPVGVDDEGNPVEFSTRKRKLDAIAADIRAAWPDNAQANLLACAVEQSHAVIVNNLLESHFTGRPQVNFGSPKQMQRLLYEEIGMTPRVFNTLTDKQRQDPKFREAHQFRRKWLAGVHSREPTPEERAIWLCKASTDDDAVELALYRDGLPEREQKVLRAYLRVKELTTRINLFYNTYATIPHWKDGRIHASMNQCQTVTRRYSCNDPNLQQLPSRGEGIKFRTLLPAPRDCVYVSLDFSGQELRLMAELSGDEAMRSCYMGGNLRDIHSLVAVRSAPFIWGEKVEYEDFMAMLESSDPQVKARAKALRMAAKTTNFATQYGAAAPKVAIQLKTDEETAQKFIDAKNATFPGINAWKEQVESEAEHTGMATTMLGAIRHLRESVLSPNAWVASKAARQASNFMIQGSGAEMAKLAMCRMWQSGIFTGGLRAWFVGPIHDEVVFIVHRDDAPAAIRAAHQAMTENYAGMSIPLVSELAIGRDFSAPVELGGDFTDEEVRQAVVALFDDGDQAEESALETPPAPVLAQEVEVV